MRFNLIYLVSLVASQFTFDTYSSVIASVKLPTYSAIQRQSIISQIKNLLAIYVNAESKFDYYHYTPSINDLESANTDFDFHSKASNLFLRFRDFHTNYYLPGPYSCYRLIYPLDFDFYGNQILVSSLFFDKSNKHDLNLSGIDIGDELVFFNNMTFSQIYELKKEAIGGANLYGSMRSVLTFLSFQSGKLYILPTETTVEYTLMKPNGTIYKTRHPVLARYSKQCVASFKKSKPSNYRMISERDTPTIDHDDMMIHPYLHELPEQSNSLLKTSEDFSYKIYKTKTNFVLGVLKISSFIPKTDPKTALRNLITLLYNELFNTSALIIDVRNNGGGAISLADSIPQLFIQNIKTASARALKSNINTRIFLNPEFKTDWGPAYRDSNGTYSKLVKFTSDRIANYIGQVYLKPIALLTNSACYSACDLFTANLKDAGVTIFGHDSTTGGGGANVVEMNGYLSPRVPDIFPGLPFGQDMRVAWRQVVRRNGLLVEDNGVASDYMVKPVIGDLNGVVVSYFETIGNHLESIAKISGASFTSCMSNVNLVYATPDTQSDVEVGSRVVFDCTFSFMTSLILIIDNFTGDEIVVGSLTTAKSIKSSSARLESFNVISLTGIDNYKIVGYLDYRQVLITRRKIRYIPRKVDFLTLEQGYTNIINFTNSFTGIYNIDTNNELGWNLKNDILVIQDGESYSNNVDSSVSFFIDIPQSTVAVSGCVKSTDYWSSNLDDQTWFLSPKFFLDNESIPITAIMDPFEYPGIYYYLAREAISARLNILNKSPASERVLTILTDTFSVLQQYNQFDLDSKVKVNDSVYLVSQLINFLIQYNTGLNIKDTGDPPSCVFNPAFNVGLEFDCEMGQDKISINVKVDGQVIRRLDSFSGIEHVDRSFYLDGFIGKSFEIEVRFVSDEDITGGAVKITTASFSL